MLSQCFDFRQFSVMSYHILHFLCSETFHKIKVVHACYSHRGDLKLKEKKNNIADIFTQFCAAVFMTSLAFSNR